MKVKRLEKLQKHLRTLRLFKVKDCSMSLSKKDNTRFAMYDYEFDCGMPACVAGHAKLIFHWKDFSSWEDKFSEFFDLIEIETDWITSTFSYRSKDPTPETASKHIQDVLNGKFK